MDSLLNDTRPPVFCPGCSHERITHTLDKAFQNMGLAGHHIAMVSDIGCSGLFDTFFNTHALHGLHGRALTYAAGLKLGRPVSLSWILMRLAVMPPFVSMVTVPAGGTPVTTQVGSVPIATKYLILLPVLRG